MARSTYSLRKAVVDIALPQSTVITAYAETGIKITITRLSQKQATTKASFSPKVDFGALELPSSACLQYWMAAQCDKFFQTMSTFSPPMLNLNSKKSVAEPLGQTRAQLATLRLLLLMEMMLAVRGGQVWYVTVSGNSLLSSSIDIWRLASGKHSCKRRKN